MLVQDISYSQAMRSIRELVLDLGLVQCFRVSGRDLSISKTIDKVSVGEVVKDIDSDEMYKLYDLVALLVEKELSVELLPDYVATEFVSGLINFSIPNVNEPIEGHVIKAKNYFTNEAIESVMLGFFSKFSYFTGYSRQTSSIFDEMDYFTKRRLILWTAYYLVETKRMNMASTSVLINNAKGELGCGGLEFKNTAIETTTRVGEVFSQTERNDESGKGMDGFTDLWGDKYGYLTKLQLYIRGLYEKLFNDYSLRDDAMINQTFSMQKTWEMDAWVNTHKWSRDTYGLLVENRDVQL